VVGGRKTVPLFVSAQIKRTVEGEKEENLYNVAGAGRAAIDADASRTS